MIPKCVTSIEEEAFAYCGNLKVVYFQGNAPLAYSSPYTVFTGDNAIIYYFPGTAGWGTTFGGCPTALWTVPTAQISANPTNGAIPLQVNFTSADIDSAGNAITNWNWTFGDGSTSTLQSPSHIYTNNGAFYPHLVATNRIGGEVIGFGPSILVGFLGGLVVNGGFETGDFSSWGGDMSGAFVSIVSTYVHSGQYGAELGPPGTLGHLSQTLATTAGKRYLLSLWLDSPDGQAPNEFQVSWNGTLLFDEMNIPAIGWTNLQFLVTATGTSMVLEFGFRDDPSYFGLDDISIVPQLDIGGFKFSGKNLVVNGLNGVSGGTNYVLTSTNLTNPLNQWTRAATNVLDANGSFTITITNAVISGSRQQFYMLQSPGTVQ
jgi:hypothetical protein